MGRLGLSLGRYNTCIFKWLQTIRFQWADQRIHWDCIPFTSFPLLLGSNTPDVSRSDKSCQHLWGAGALKKGRKPDLHRSRTVCGDEETHSIPGFPSACSGPRSSSGCCRVIQRCSAVQGGRGGLGWFLCEGPERAVFFGSDRLGWGVLLAAASGILRPLRGLRMTGESSQAPVPSSWLRSRIHPAVQLGALPGIRACGIPQLGKPEVKSCVDRGSRGSSGLHPCTNSSNQNDTSCHPPAPPGGLAMTHGSHRGLRKCGH